jgi:pyruvate/2-oxoglutarate dehydrogenase complex dihydrolipoamide acyltransferase (E2) component
MMTVVTAPQINTNDDRLEVVAWHVRSGSYVDRGQDVADVETSKSIVTLTAERAGYVEYVLNEHSVVKVGDPLYRIAATIEELPPKTSDELSASTPMATEESRCVSAGAGLSAKTNSPQPPAPGGVLAHGTYQRGRFDVTRFSKAAAELVAARGMSERDFPGVGLVTTRDLVRLFGLDRAATAAVTPASHAMVGPEASVSVPQNIRRERLTLAKLAEVAALSVGESSNMSSSLTVQFASAKLRERLTLARAFDGSPLPLVLYELSRLLRAWPQFTAFYEGEAIHYYDRIDLGLAIDLGRGLKVVTIGKADKLMPADFHLRVLDAGMRYLENRLRPEELADSTFTISDLSGYDILHFRPLINGRQSAIIGLGADRTLAGYPMCITMTFDHRLATGREVAAFLNELRARILTYAEDSGRLRQVSEFPADDEGATPRYSTHCDRCGIEAETYYSNFQEDAYLLVYHREDGSLGGVCHRCFGRWN